MSSSFKSSKPSIIASKGLVAVVPDGSLNRPLASRREVGDAGIGPSGRPGVERHLGRDVGVPQSSNDGHRGGAVEVSGWGTRPGRFQKKALVA
jgi:hypothetical protein